MAKSRATYIPNKNIQSLNVKNGKRVTEIKNKDILDGAYVRKGVKFKKGGNSELKDFKTYVWKSKKDVLSDNYEVYIDEEMTKKEVIEFYKERMRRGYCFAVQIYEKDKNNQIYRSESFDKTWEEYDDEDEYAKGSTISGFLNKAKNLGSKGIDSVKSGYGKSKDYANKKIYDIKKKNALDVLSELGMRANVSRKEEEKIVSPAYDLVYDKYAKGGGVKKYQTEQEAFDIKEPSFQKFLKANNIESSFSGGAHRYDSNTYVFYGTKPALKKMLIKYWLMDESLEDANRLAEEQIEEETYKKGGALSSKKMSTSYKLNDDDKHDVDILYYTHKNKMSKSELKKFISEKLNINYFEISSYIDRNNYAKGGGVGNSKVFVATKEGKIEVYSGSDARSAEVKVGDIFLVTEEMKNGIYYLGKLNIKGSFKLSPGLSGKNVSKMNAGKQDEILYLLRKENIDGDSNFFAQFKKHNKYAKGSNVGGQTKEIVEIKGYYIKHIKNSYDDYWYFIYDSTPFEFETKEDAIKSLNDLIKTRKYAKGGAIEDLEVKKLYEDILTFAPDKVTINKIKGTNKYRIRVYEMGFFSTWSDNAEYHTLASELEAEYPKLNIEVESRLGNDYSPAKTSSIIVYSKNKMEQGGNMNNDNPYICTYEIGGL